jgi:hypothetical protein
VDVEGIDRDGRVNEVRGTMPIEGQQTDGRPDAAVFEVSRTRTNHAVPGGVVVALVVGVLAFVGGIAVASSGPVQPPQTARVPASVPAVTDASPAVGRPAGSPDAAPAAAAVPDSSAFARRFAPGSLVSSLPGGSSCVTGEPRSKEVPRTRRDGPRLTSQKSWLIWCPVSANRRQKFMLALFDGLVARVPAETYGYSTANAGAGDALFPYAEAPFAGTVAVTADAAGAGFSIAIVLQEWLAQ